MYTVPYANAVGGVVYWDDQSGLYVLESNSLSWQSIETRGCVLINTEYGMVAVIPVGMLMYGKVSQENYVELTAVSAIPNKEIKSPQILRY